MTSPSAGEPPKDFLGSDEAHRIARCVRGCATDDQYVELLWRIDEALNRRAAPPATASEQGVERVARAIYEKSEHFWTWEKAAQYRFPDGRDGQDFYRDLARAAIAALPASGEREKASRVMLDVLRDFKNTCDNAPDADLMVSIHKNYERACAAIAQAEAAGVTSALAPPPAEE